MRGSSGRVQRRSGRVQHRSGRVQRSSGRVQRALAQVVVRWPAVQQARARILARHPSVMVEMKKNYKNKFKLNNNRMGTIILQDDFSETQKIAESDFGWPKSSQKSLSRCKWFNAPLKRLYH